FIVSLRILPLLDLFTTLCCLLVRSYFFFFMIPPPPLSTLFPYTTLFRSRQAGGNAMKRIAALVPLLLVLTAGASPGRRGVAPRDGEVKAVSVVPAAGSVEVVIDLRGAVDIQDFTLGNPARLVVDLQGARLVAPAVLYDGANRGGIKNLRYAQFRPGVVRVVIDLDALKDYQIERRDDQVRVKIGSERTAFEAWSSKSVASAPPAAVVPPVAQRTAGRGGQAARVATPAQSG